MAHMVRAFPMGFGDSEHGYDLYVAEFSHGGVSFQVITRGSDSSLIIDIVTQLVKKG